MTGRLSLGPAQVKTSLVDTCSPSVWIHIWSLVTHFHFGAATRNFSLKLAFLIQVTR